MNNQDNKSVTSAALYVVNSEVDLLLRLKYQGRVSAAIVVPWDNDGGAGVASCLSPTAS